MSDFTKTLKNKAFIEIKRADNAYYATNFVPHCGTLGT